MGAQLPSPVTTPSRSMLILTSPMGQGMADLPLLSVLGLQSLKLLIQHMQPPLPCTAGPDIVGQDCL